MDFYKLNILFTPIFYWCGFFYSNIILKLDFGYNIFVFEVIMFLFSNFLILVRFFCYDLFGNIRHV